MGPGLAAYSISSIPGSCKKFPNRGCAASGCDDRHHVDLLPRADGTLRSSPSSQRSAVQKQEEINDIAVGLDENDPQIPPEVVSFIRFGALAISAGARRTGWGAELIRGYVDIAAGITAMERRADGRAPRNEVVVLVRG